MLLNSCKCLLCESTELAEETKLCADCLIKVREPMPSKFDRVDTKFTKVICPECSGHRIVGDKWWEAGECTVCDENGHAFVDEEQLLDMLNEAARMLGEHGMIIKVIVDEDLN